MKFTDYILIDAINPELKATDKEGVIREMVQSLLDADGIEQEDYEAIVKSLLKQAELGGIYLGRDVALPNVYHPSMKRHIMAVAVSTEGIECNKNDDEKVHFFFMVIYPPPFSGDTLRIAEHLTRRFKDGTLRERLLCAKTREEILALLEEDDNKEAMKKR